MAKAHKRSGPREIKEFEEEVLQIDRVTRVVAGGRRMRFRATVVIGNRKKRVGIGTGKANEVVIAIEKAISKAKKNLITVPVENDTIPHEIKVKFKASKIILMPAKTGTGIIAGGVLRKIVELAGVKNILSKCLGTNNKLANAQATIMALGKLKSRGQESMDKLTQKPAPKKPVEKNEAAPEAPREEMANNS
ncbi:MAG: 30S ribosomal protein S5 [Patescibacteria group bacterium]